MTSSVVHIQQISRRFSILSARYDGERAQHGTACAVPHVMPIPALKSFLRSLLGNVPGHALALIGKSFEDHHRSQRR